MNGAHVERRPGKTQNFGNRVGNLGFSGACRSAEKKAVAWKRMRPVNLDDGFNDTLLDFFKAVQLFI